MTIEKLIKAYEKAMDFVMQEPDDLCSKCSYFKGVDGYGENGSCEYHDKNGIIACQEGIVEYFKKELAYGCN